VKKEAFIYIITNYEKTTLYIGVTNDIERRILEHKIGQGSGFSSRYKLKHLMYFEEHTTIKDAIEREKQLKNWHKDWKWNLIKEENPQLLDLAADWYDEEMIKENII
jgi:putative endonuclease